jgi:hypothetical protein
MNKEYFYGNDTRFDRNDDYASDFTAASSFRTPEDNGGEKARVEDSTPHLDIHNSNRFFDKFLFYFSSKL